MERFGMSWKKLLALVMAFMMIAAMVPMTAIAGESPEHISDFSRIYGRNRFETALFIAEQMKHNFGVEKFDAIIIASGNDFADALAGSYLANVRRAPILLSWGKGGDYEWLDDNNIAYIQDNLAEGGTVYILGGTNAVPELYENSLADRNVCRLGGENRFATNLLILEEAGILPGEEILVCTATNFADSLSASATGLPILLVWNEGGKLFDNQKAFLSGFDDNSYCIIGGENAVSDALLTAISEYGNVTRLAGKDRFDTSVLVAERYFGFNDSVVLAYAWNYPDGLCGGALAYSMGCPLILTMNCYETAASKYVDKWNLHKCVILGGTGLISDESADAVFGDAVPGHAYANVVVDPTEDRKGYTQHTCSKCGHSYRDNYTEKLPDTRWKDAYRQLIIEQAQLLPSTDYFSCYFIYLNDDTVPELWINSGYSYAGCRMITYHNGKAICNEVSDGSLRYIDRGNVFVHTYGRQGVYGDTIYKIRNGKFEILAEGERMARPDEHGWPSNEEFDYSWNGKVVSENEYEKKIGQFIDLDDAITVGDYFYGYNEVLDYLTYDWWGAYYGCCDRCGESISDWNFMVEGFGLCSRCYYETLDPAYICAVCGCDCSYCGTIDGLCPSCYDEAHAN